MRKLVVSLAAGLLVIGIGCGGDDSTSSDPTTANTPEPTKVSAPIEVPMTEFAFAAPETIPAGKVKITAVNKGDQKHEMGVILVAEGGPPTEELLKLDDAGLQEYVDDFFGTNGPIAPGEEKTFTVEAESGRTLAYACFVTDPKTKKPHAFLGMFGEIEVE